MKKIITEFTIQCHQPIKRWWLLASHLNCGMLSFLLLKTRWLDLHEFSSNYKIPGFQHCHSHHSLTLAHPCLSAPHPRSTSQSLPSSPSTSRPGSWWALSLSLSPKENAGKGMIHSILAAPYYQAHLRNYIEESTACITTMMTETVKDAKPQGDGRRRCGEKDPLGPSSHHSRKQQTIRLLTVPEQILIPACSWRKHHWLRPLKTCLPTLDALHIQTESWALGKEKITVYK